LTITASGPNSTYVAGEGDDGLDDRLHATCAGPEIASSTSERRRPGTHGGATHAPRVGVPVTARYSPRGALGERFTCRPRPRIAVSNAPASATPTTARSHARRHARIHRACAATGRRLRSIPQGPCFMTSPDVTRTSVACEVKLYLAVPSPLFFPPLFPRSDRCLVAGPAPGLLSIRRCGAGARRRFHEPLAHQHGQRALMDRVVGDVGVVSLSAVSRREAQAARLP